MPKARKTTPEGARHPSPKRAPGVRLLETLPVLDLLRACTKLAELWALNTEEIAGLLGTSRSTWFRWLEAAETGREPLWTADQRARALALLRIFEAAGDLEQRDEDLLRWAHAPLEGPGFGGRTPLEVMKSGFEGLLLVRDYLNFLHGAWD